MERLAWPPLVVVKYPTGESEEISLHLLDQVFGETQQPYCTINAQVIDIGKILEDCKDPDEVSD